MIHNDFAQLESFTQSTEVYTFSAKMNLTDESLLMGSTTKIVVTPMLHLNGMKADLSLLKNVSVVLSTENYIDKVPVTKEFTGLSF